MKKLKEMGLNYPNDHRSGGGYGRTQSKLDVERPGGAEGWPYDLYEIPEDEEPYFDNPEMQQKFSSKTGQRLPSDSMPKHDQFTYFDGSTVGLRGENTLRNYVRLFLEDSAIRLRPRSSEPDGAVTQWGTRMPGGSKTGWSTAFPFKDVESYEPVTSLKDLLAKNDPERPDHEAQQNDPEKDWKSDVAQQKYDSERIDIYNTPLRDKI